MTTAAIQVWTDGACIDNPGPMGIGVVLIDGEHRQELSEALGHGTNNIAELTAIERGIELAAARCTDGDGKEIAVYSDSAYAIGILSKKWKAKANQDLVARIRALVASVRRIRFVKVRGALHENMKTGPNSRAAEGIPAQSQVRGHSGVAENERCDELAESAATGKSTADDKSVDVVSTLPCRLWRDGQHLFSGPTDKDLRMLGPSLNGLAPVKTCLCGVRVAGTMPK